MENYSSDSNNSVMSVVDWIIVLILMAIPLVNLIVLCIWAFGGSTPLVKANFAKAALIMMVIGFVLTFLLWGSIAAMIAGSMY